MSSPSTVAIDGPVASGKTVIGRLLAQQLGYRFLDTGMMYRAATWAAMKNGVDLSDHEALSRLAHGLDMTLVPNSSGDRLLVDGKDVTDLLRDSELERKVSLVASAPGVRAAMVRQQRAMANQGPIIMVGRDIGTIVLPNADVKVFLTASVDVRAQRRYRELLDRGVPADLDQVKADLLRRDKIDSERKDSPLRPADDATVIDTDDLTIEQVADRVMSILRARAADRANRQGQSRH